MLELEAAGQLEFRFWSLLSFIQCISVNVKKY